MSKLRKLLPDEDFLYFGDTLHMPYGEKSKQELFEFADKIFKFFIDKNAKAVVMACNTTSSVIYDDIRDKYDLKIYPVIQSVAKILAEEKVKTLGVFATPATVKSNAYKTEIQKYNSKIEVVQIACPQWVKIVEENSINAQSSKLHIKEKMDEMLKFAPDKIVLGCTHYPYLLDSLSKLFPKEKFIDPAKYFAEYIASDLGKSDLLEKASGLNEIHVSSNPKLFQISAERFLKLDETPTLTVL